MKGKVFGLLLLCLLPLCALSEEAFVVLTSYEEHPAWQEEFDEHKGLFYPQRSYYSFGNERHGPDLIEVSGEESYLLFSDLDYLDAAKLLYEKGLQPEDVHHGYASYWVRVQLHVPQGYRVAWRTSASKTLRMTCGSKWCWRKWTASWARFGSMTKCRGCAAASIISG